MTRIVLETNIVVSALLNDEGNEAAVLLLGLQGRILLYLSHSIFTEYDEVLHRKKFCFDPGGVRRVLHLVVLGGNKSSATKMHKITEENFGKAQATKGRANRGCACPSSSSV